MNLKLTVTDIKAKSQPKTVYLFFLQLGPEEKTSMKKRINLVVVGFGVVFAIFSTGLIIYGWFNPHHLAEPCKKLLDSIVS